MGMLNTNSSNLNEGNNIRHEGVITGISDSSIKVALKGNINCEACNAKSVCGVNDSEMKEVDVYHNRLPLKLNQTVTVVLSKSLGLRAVLLAYVLPFILVLAVLIVSSSLVAEWLAGVISLLVLIPYYIILHSLNKNFRKTFQFSIIKNSMA